MGGWGLKNIFNFSKALAENCGWRLIDTIILWMEVILHKYVAPILVSDWLRYLTRKEAMISVVWKVVLNSLDVIWHGLVWKVGNGRSVSIGIDSYPRSDFKHILPQPLLEALK